MFAVIKTGGKQYVVTEGMKLEIEKIIGEAGSTFSFTDVLLVSDKDNVVVGTPVVTGATVTTTIIKQFKDDKVEVNKFKPKTGYRRKKGHRQQKTEISIDNITW
ncbi:MAG: 50S ribosomal protein L21 [Patescibacteria group bacterium]